MRRRGTVSRKPAKPQHRKTRIGKRGKALKAAPVRDPFAASLQEQLDQRTRQLNEALEHQTATNAVLSVISRSPADAYSMLSSKVPRFSVKRCSVVSISTTASTSAW